MIRKFVLFLEARTGQSSFISKTLRYVFPDHWSFLIGEIALYAFIVLVATGIYLTFFFDPSLAPTVYRGSYEPLVGTPMSQAYESAVSLSLDVKGGLLMRQTHHWAALVMVVAIVLHLMRIFFTGAFRKPRDLTYYIGVTLLILVLVEGFAGYSLPDDLLSGMGLAIGYSVVMAIPIVGVNLAYLVWGGEFPGAERFESLLFSGHVIILPALIGILIAAHLALVMLVHHTQFRGRGRTEQNVVGTPMWPAQALRSGGLLLATAGILLLLGGLVQINPIWQYGPYEPYVGTNGAQPDWYMGWLIGALRIMPDWEAHVFGYTILPNPFFGGILLPTLVFGLLYAWPALERRITGDNRVHHLLDRPRDVPWRTATGTAFFAFLVVLFVAGGADRLYVSLGIPYPGLIIVFRVLVFVLPALVFAVTYWMCKQLRDSEAHPLRGWTGSVVRRGPAGGFERVETRKLEEGER
jgi:ubiquinol-cytochrome c reductase cytochrome b subunit